MSDQLSAADKQTIINKLDSKGAKITCPMCGNKSFILGDGYFNQPLSKNIQNVVIGGPTIPTIPIVCNNCGFVSQHALGVLGLLNQK